MNTPNASKINPVIFKQEAGEQSVRMIKASQAGKFLNGTGSGHAHNGNEAARKPEIHMIHSGADYCDIEVICSCGEKTQVRCWNTPAASEKNA